MATPGLRLSDIVDSFELERTGETTFSAGNVDIGGPMVYGGQILGQLLVAAQAMDPAKSPRTIHTVFAKPGSVDQPLEITCEVMHSGRALGSVTATATQGERLCARSIVLLSADEPDFIGHADPAPELAPPGDDLPVHPDEAFDTRIVGDVDVNDPGRVAPPRLDVWVRSAGAPVDQVVNRALLAYVSDGFLIGTAMLPHEGVGQSQAHVSIATAVVGHTLTFYDDVDMREWVLLSHVSDHAGGGRSHGSARVFDATGRLVASYTQDAMIRGM
jgi:acyl-CoA thioesterase-2